MLRMRPTNLQRLEACAHEILRLHGVFCTMCTIWNKALCGAPSISEEVETSAASSSHRPVPPADFAQLCIVHTIEMHT